MLNVVDVLYINVIYYYYYYYTVLSADLSDGYFYVTVSCFAPS